MSLNTPEVDDVLNAAANIVSAFEANDRVQYFSSFSPQASFIFHPEPQRLNSRAEYEALWDSWIASGWRVLSCSSSEQLVQVFPGGAVFSHTVYTHVRLDDGSETSYQERESIIFTQGQNGTLTAIHEHLSTVPETPALGSSTQEPSPSASAE